MPQQGAVECGRSVIESREPGARFSISLHKTPAQYSGDKETALYVRYAHNLLPIKEDTNSRTI